MPTYAWRTTNLFAVDPQVAGERLEDLAEKRGGSFTKVDVLEDALNPESPLYGCLEQNDSDAAEKYRQGQARTIVGNLVLAPKGKATRTRAFVFLHADATSYGRKAFVPLAHAMRTSGLREQVVEQALRQFMRWFEQFGGLKELRPHRQQIVQLKESIERDLLATLNG